MCVYIYTHIDADVYVYVLVHVYVYVDVYVHVYVYVCACVYVYMRASSVDPVFLCSSCVMFCLYNDLVFEGPICAENPIVANQRQSIVELQNTNQINVPYGFVPKMC